MAAAISLSAEMLQRGAGGLAGYAASLLIERYPDLRDRYAPRAHDAWKSHLTQRVLELAAALAMAEPKMFAARVSWSRRGFVSRGHDQRDIGASLEALRDVLADHLPPAAAAEPVAYIDQALPGLDAPLGDDQEALDPADEFGRIALRYLEGVLRGDGHRAIEELVALCDAPHGARQLYLDVLLPAQREVGRLWHVGDITVAEEHLVTFATQRAMALLVHRARPRDGNGYTAISACAPGNAHDIGVRAANDVFQLEGWRALFFGSDVPLDDLPVIVSYFEADVLLLGATLSTQIPVVARSIAAIRERSDRRVAIIVGGAAFDEVPDVGGRIGADAYAPGIDQALTMARGLVQAAG